MAGDELSELLVGIGVELACEMEQLTVGLLLEAAPQGYRQALQFGNGSRSWITSGAQCREHSRICITRNTSATGRRAADQAWRRSAISAAKREKW
jgi:hypothetical protein